MVRILNVMLGKKRGGLENVFIQHACIFEDLGFVSKALCVHKSASEDEFKRRGFSQVETICSPKLYNPIFWVLLVWKIKRFHPDIIWLHGNRAIFCCSAKWVRLLVGKQIKLVGTTHNDRNRLFYRLDKILSITKYLKKRLIEYWKIDERKIILCPNVAYPISRSFSNYHKEVPCIGFLGRLESVKGCDLLIRACSLLKKHRISFHLLIGGDGSQRLLYEELCHQYDIQDCVTFLGWVQDKGAFFNQVDIMSFPSRSEALPLSLIESCAYRKPVVVTSCPGMVEVVSQLGCGEVVALDDSFGLFNKLRLLIQNADYRHLLSERSHKTFMDFYHIDIQKRVLHKTVLELMDEK